MQRNHWQPEITWLALLVTVAGDFLIPREWMASLYLAGNLQQMLVCSVLMFCLLQRHGASWSGSDYINFRSHLAEPASVSAVSWLAPMTIGVILYIGLLETAQLATPDRHARWHDFILNSTAVLFTSVLLWLINAVRVRLPSIR
jgi:hypothetical protein